MIKIFISMLFSFAILNAAACSWMASDLAGKMTKAQTALTEQYANFNKEILNIQSEYSKVYLNQFESTLKAEKIKLLRIKSVALKSAIRDNLKAIAKLQKQ